jgi:Flp pilus assembly protein TadB
MSSSTQPREADPPTRHHCAPQPPQAGYGALDKEGIRYIAVCLLAVLGVAWLLGPFMGMAALIVLATLYFVWREPVASHGLALRWDEHYEQPGRMQ